MEKAEENLALVLVETKNFLSTSGQEYLSKIFGRDDEDSCGVATTYLSSPTNGVTSSHSCIIESSSMSNSPLLGSSSLPLSSNFNSNNNSFGDKTKGSATASTHSAAYPNWPSGRLGAPGQICDQSNVLCSKAASILLQRPKHVTQHHLSPLRVPLGDTRPSTRDDLLLSCRQLPVCRKIIEKTPPIPRYNRRSPCDAEHSNVSTSSLEHGRRTEFDEKPDFRAEEKMYRKIVGKISETPPAVGVLVGKLEASTSTVMPTSSNTTILRTAEIGASIGSEDAREPACDFRRPVTNPLYKEYDPQGYKKSEDELAAETIEDIAARFNEWLKTLDADYEKSDVAMRFPDTLKGILRADMELRVFP